MAYDEGLRVAAVQILEEYPEGSLLLGCAGVGGLTADVEPALVADAYRVGIVVQAVGTDHPFRPSWLNLSVTTDHVMISYAEVETPIAMPCIDLSRRARLVRPHCRTVNHYQCNTPHDCIRNVDTKAVITVRMKLPIFSAGMFLNNLIKIQ